MVLEEDRPCVGHYIVYFGFIDAADKSFEIRGAWMAADEPIGGDEEASALVERLFLGEIG